MVPTKSLLIRSSSLPDAGMGLFTTVDIHKGERIVEYKGRLVKWKDVKHTDGHNGYLLRLDRSLAIDARPKNSGKGRYANDAMGLVRLPGLRNNAEYLIYGKRVFIEATRNIRKGEEVLVAYGREFWALQRKLKADRKRENRQH
ncbi:MAG: SET domain-containing protein [Cyclobacteriaceae bacterium]|nr:SET domain-containing protein [Cyclobacteriaceae bacterium]